MKRLVLFLILSGQYFVANGQIILDEKDTLLISKYQSSNVKSVTAYSHVCTRGKCPKEGELKKSMHFDSLNNLVQLTTFEHKRILLNRKYVYDMGNLINEKVFKKSGVLLMNINYSYLNGLISEITNIGGSGKPRYYEKRTYDDHSQIMFQMTVNIKGDTTIKRLKNKYNSIGLLETSEEFSNGKSIRLQTFEYDAYGNVLVVYIVNSENEKLLLNEYLYNDAGLLSTEKFYDKGLLHTTHHYEYDEKSRIVNEAVIDHAHETTYIVRRKFNRRGLKSDYGHYELDSELDYKFVFRRTRKGLEKKVLVYDKAGKVDRSVHRKFDKKGNVTQLSFKGKNHVYLMFKYKIDYY